MRGYAYSVWRFRPDAAASASTGPDASWHRRLPDERHIPFSSSREEQDDLQIAVHSKSFETANTQTLHLLESFLWFAPRHFRVFASPGHVHLRSEEGDVATFTSRPEPDSRFENTFTVDLVTNTREIYSSFLSRYPHEYQLHRMGIPADDAHGLETARMHLEELQAAGALKANIFLTEDSWLLSRRTELEREIGVWIRSLSETIDYVDHVIKERGLYLFNYIVRTSKSAYYDERLNELVPEWRSAWDGIRAERRGSREWALTEEYLRSLRGRLRHLLD